MCRFERLREEFEIGLGAGPAWWATDKKTREFREEMVGASQRELPQLGRELDPFLLIEQSDESSPEKDEEREASKREAGEHRARVVRPTEGPKGVGKWWKRAIASVPHPMIWRRIGEVRERNARGERLNMGSYLAKLVSIDATRLNLPWTTRDSGSSEKVASLQRTPSRVYVSYDRRRISAKYAPSSILQLYVM